jgi:hypothetical protein
MTSYHIYDIKILKNIIFPIFDKYPLLTSKHFYYINFKKALDILEDSTLLQTKKNDLIENLINQELPKNYISPALPQVKEFIVDIMEKIEYKKIKDIINIY